MSIKKNIPNAITCCNLICGCLAIIQVFSGNLIYASYLVGLAAVFDFLDGLFARLLKVSSPIGKDLDSLADMVTFGVVPGLTLFKMIKGNFYDCDIATPIMWICYFGLIVTIFSAIRLAKFNHDTRQSESFIGLPTPANAIMIMSIPLATPIDSVFRSEVYLIIISVVSSYLLVSEIPLFALKFKQFKWKGNEIRYMFLIISLVLLLALQFIAIPLIIILYLVMSMLNNFWKKG